MRYQFSANTGYLWKDRPFLDRIRQAAAHGFAAVEFHDEAQSTDLAELQAVLQQTELPVSGLNTRMQDTFGRAALPGKGDQAKRDVDEAIRIAEAVGARAIHVLAGLMSGPDAHTAYLETLRHAVNNTDRVILIEPVSHEQLPGYFMRTIDQAAAVLEEIGHPRLMIMFDCYHILRENGDLITNFRAHVKDIGHVQIAASENRAEPFPGEIDYARLLPEMQSCGYSGRFGCEYRPEGKTEDGLAWRDTVAAPQEVEPRS